MREGVTPSDPERAAALELVHLLRAAALKLELTIAEFARTTALHSTDVRALVSLLDAERARVEATPTWLAQRLGMTSQATTAVIHRLEAAGHVQRRRSRTDGRSARLEVSDSAVELGWQFFGPLLDRMIAATQALDEQQQAGARAYLEAVTETLG
jgi:DNA-binding MarR family transcriptional regulator